MSGMEESEADARPDLQAVWPETALVESEFDTVTGLPLTACPVCGILTVVEGMHEQICPVCGWEQDDTFEDIWQESAPNGGLSLMEARLNFRAFGKIDPMEPRKGEQKDAEF